MHYDVGDIRELNHKVVIIWKLTSLLGCNYIVTQVVVPTQLVWSMVFNKPYLTCLHFIFLRLCMQTKVKIQITKSAHIICLVWNRTKSKHLIVSKILRDHIFVFGQRIGIIRRHRADKWGVIWSTVASIIRWFATNTSSLMARLDNVQHRIVVSVYAHLSLSLEALETVQHSVTGCQRIVVVLHINDFTWLVL